VSIASPIFMEHGVGKHKQEHLPGFETITSIVSGLYLTKFGIISASNKQRSSENSFQL